MPLTAATDVALIGLATTAKLLVYQMQQTERIVYDHRYAYGGCIIFPQYRLKCLLAKVEG